MAHPLRVSLGHEGMVLAEWSTHMKPVTIGEVWRHIPAGFETCCYNSFLGDEELSGNVPIDGSVNFTLMHSMFSVSVMLRLVSGEKFMEWPTCAPYTRLADLGIPRARKTYQILKQDRTLEDHEHIWEEGDAAAVQLTMVVLREPGFVFHLYLHVGGPDEYEALLLPHFSVQVPALSQKVFVRAALHLLYQMLLETGGDFAKHAVALLQEDINVGRVLRRDLLPFVRAAGKNERHIGHARAIAMLGNNNRFVLRLKKEMFVLEDTPTVEQTRAVEDSILGLPLVVE